MSGTALAGLHGGVKLQRLNTDVLRAELLRLELHVSDDPKEMIERLRRYYKDQQPSGMRFTRCDQCGGISDKSLTHCPYCGERDDDQEADTNGGVLKGAEPDSKVQAKIAEVVAEAQPAVLALDSLPGNQRLKLDKPGLPARNRQPIDELAVQVKVIQNATRAAATNLHSIGVALTIINQGDLWKQRRKGDKQKFTSFAAFVLDEFGMTKQYAYQLISIAKSFDAKTIAEVGPHKLRLAMTVTDDSQRAEVVKLAKTGTVQRVQETVDKLRGVERAKVAQDGRKKMREPPKVTVALQPGMVRIPLYKRDKTLKNTQQASVDASGKVKGGKVAKNLGDDPFGRLRLSNDVVQIFKILRNRNDELYLTVETRRAVDQL